MGKITVRPAIVTHLLEELDQTLSGLEKNFDRKHALAVGVARLDYVSYLLKCGDFDNEHADALPTLESWDSFKYGDFIDDIYKPGYYNDEKLFVISDDVPGIDPEYPFMLWGGGGSGKTRALYSAVMGLVLKHVYHYFKDDYIPHSLDVVKTSSGELISVPMFKVARLEVFSDMEAFTYRIRQAKQDHFELMKTANVLLIDNYGMGKFPTKAYHNYLLAILEHRLRHGLYTSFASNKRLMPASDDPKYGMQYDDGLLFSKVAGLIKLPDGRMNYGYHPGEDYRTM